MNSWCVGNVKDMSGLFQDMDTFNENINGWDTSSVTNMEFMFKRTTSFNRDVSNFNTSSVTKMNAMFNRATSFNQDLSNFDTSSVTKMQYMFRYASSFNGYVSNFDITSVTDMNWMFESTSSFNQDLCSWRDSFPYTNAFNIFTNSNCTYRDTPQEDQKGPFCASECGSSSSISPTISLAPSTSQPTTEASSPQESPISSPPSKLTIATFPSDLIIQGLVWLDENENGLYETDEETPLENIFVNLRKCDGNTYVSTKTTNSNGQYQFTGMDEGEYFVEFFKPSPSSNYDFTLPKVAGDDETALDSDVVIQNDGKIGKSDCMVAKEGFNTLTNAGFLRLIVKVKRYLITTIKHMQLL